MAVMHRIYIDKETTGLDPVVNGLTQLAFIIEDADGKILESGSFDIKPFEGSKVERKALEVTEKTYDEVMGYEDEGVVLERFLSILRRYINVMSYDENFTISGYNVAFDIGFLEAWMLRHNKKFFSYFNYRSVDPLAFLRILDWYGYTNLENYKLTTVYKAIFDEELNAHNAIDDIAASRKILKYLEETFINEKP